MDLVEQTPRMVRRKNARHANVPAILTKNIIMHAKDAVTSTKEMASVIAIANRADRILHLNIRIYGRVQGVFFRQTSKEMADVLNIKGFVRNEFDSNVYIEAEGEEKKLRKFLHWCKEGPRAAAVEKVEVQDGEVQRFCDFKIL